MIQRLAEGLRGLGRGKGGMGKGRSRFRDHKPRA